MRKVTCRSKNDEFRIFTIENNKINCYKAKVLIDINFLNSWTNNSDEEMSIKEIISIAGKENLSFKIGELIGEMLIIEDETCEVSATDIDSEKPKSSNYKLSEEQKSEIIRRLSKGEKQTALAKDYRITQGAISQLWSKFNQTIDEIVI